MNRVFLYSFFIKLLIILYAFSKFFIRQILIIAKHNNRFFTNLIIFTAIFFLNSGHNDYNYV